MATRPQLLIMTGPMAGKRFSVPEGGLRFGRSSSNDVHIPDEELSRNHCLFEPDGDGQIRIIDLASANGTYVNGKQLGADAERLKFGDVIEAGATAVKVVDEDAPDVAALDAARTAPLSAHIDLGLGTLDGDAGAAGGATAAGGGGLGTTPQALAPNPRRATLANILWGVAALSIATLIVVILLAPASAPRQAPPSAIAEPAERDVTELLYEKIEADSSRIFRYQMTIDYAGVLRVVYDDVPGENRHVDKSQRLGAEAMERIAEIFRFKGWSALDEAYTGASAENENALRRFRIRTLAGDRVREVLVENAPEPEVFQAVREALETFSRNELGVWALQYSSEKLVELAAESEKTGDAKWSEREVDTGNLAAAIGAFREAAFYLETVNPKPQCYAALKEKLTHAIEEQDRLYRDRRFLADKALNLKDWEEAQKELRTLLELVPDKNDERHIEARAKLVDVERRLEGGKRRGKRKEGAK